MSVAVMLWKTLEFTHTATWVLGHLQRFPTMLGWIAPARITHPANGGLVRTPLTVSGAHTNPKGNFWLVTNSRNEYWPKSKLHFRLNGRWDTEIHTKDGVTSSILLVKVSDLLQVTFDNWQRCANRTKDWSALILPQTIPKNDLVTVDWIIVNVAAK
jgi:hypothetical protein